jgi:SAM-dependent methyltransferase
MHRAISDSNPFRDIPRFAFGYEFIEPGMRVLDYGCMDGWFGQQLLKHKRVEYVGADKNADNATGNTPVPIVAVKDRVPFDDGFFDVATAFEVIEHVADQDGLLRELGRVLRPDGVLIVSVPKQHVFSFLDLGNLKYIFPGLHRAYFTLRYSAEQYRYRFQDNPYGLVGTVEKEKGWHEHFRESGMHALLRRNGFRVLETDGSGLFSSIFDVFGQIPGGTRLFPQNLRNWDSYAFHSRSLFCAARKAA